MQTGIFLLQYHYSQLKKLCQSHIVLSGTFSFTHRGNLAYETNYCAGLRILDISGIKADPPDIKEVGYFDVDPDCDTPGFMGSWSNYPFFESRTIIVSSIERGLFVLKYTGPQVHDSFCWSTLNPMHAVNMPHAVWCVCIISVKFMIDVPVQFWVCN